MNNIKVKPLETKESENIEIVTSQEFNELMLVYESVGRTVDDLNDRFLEHRVSSKTIETLLKNTYTSSDIFRFCKEALKIGEFGYAYVNFLDVLIQRAYESDATQEFAISLCRRRPDLHIEGTKKHPFNLAIIGGVGSKFAKRCKYWNLRINGNANFGLGKVAEYSNIYVSGDVRYGMGEWAKRSNFIVDGKISGMVLQNAKGCSLEYDDVSNVPNNKVKIITTDKRLYNRLIKQKWKAEYKQK